MTKNSGYHMTKRERSDDLTQRDKDVLDFQLVRSLPLEVKHIILYFWQPREELSAIRHPQYMSQAIHSACTHCYHTCALCMCARAHLEIRIGRFAFWTIMSTLQQMACRAHIECSRDAMRDLMCSMKHVRVEEAALPVNVKYLTPDEWVSYAGRREISFTPHEYFDIILPAFCLKYSMRNAWNEGASGEHYLRDQWMGIQNFMRRWRHTHARVVT